MTATPRQDTPRNFHDPVEERISGGELWLEEDQHVWKEQRLMPKLRPAKKEEYEAWLEGHKDLGFTPTEHCDNFEDCDFYVVQEDFIMRPLSEAEAVHILIPEEVTFCGGDLGASDLYCLDSHLHKGHWVPEFTE